MKRFTLALVFAVVAVCGTTTSTSVSAQEILLEGPLAGAPAVRKLVQYRKMRFTVGPQFTYTLLNEYMHNYLVGAELGFNFLDWFGVGLVGSYGFNSPTKLTRYIKSSRDIGGNRTTPTDSNWPSYTGGANFEEQVARLKGMYFLQLNFVLFRGKSSFFEKGFVATDIVFFIGGGIVLFEERTDCDSTLGSGGGGCGTRTNPNVTRDTKISPTIGTYGFNFDFYINHWAAINIQLRFAPYWWNAGGTDESGQAAETWQVERDPQNPGDDTDDEPVWVSRSSGGDGDYPDGKIDKDDREFHMNMSIGIGAMFLFPTTPRIGD